MKKQEAWARFWRGGSLTSFGDSFSEGYAGDLRTMWQAFFAKLPNPAVVVDLGAGNGALEEIAAAHCRENAQEMHLHAVDLAPALPARFSTQGRSDACRIEWHPATRNEATGLPEGSADAVIGNFAIEYGDDAATVREIARILKPGGTCRFLMHHANSNIIQGSATELKVLEAELRKGGFIDSVRDYLREFGDIRTPEQFHVLKQSGKAEPLRKRMNETHQEAVRLATAENAVLLIQQIMKWTGQLVSPPMFFEPKQVLLARLKEVREELQANRSRLADMQAAAVGDERVNRLVEYFSTHSMPASVEQFRVAGEDAVVGWLLNVRYR